MAGTHVLIFESSTPHASIAWASLDGVLAQREFSSDRNHNAMLFEPLAELLDNGARDQIRLVLVGSGPGSYSGTRVGIAAAQGVAMALSCPAIAVPSILAVPSAAAGAACLAIGDARRGSYWTAMMKNGLLLEDPVLCNAESLEQTLFMAQQSSIPIISFESSERFPVANNLQMAIRVEFPNASRLWQAWTASALETQQKWLSEIPQPIYLKPPHITPGKRASLLRTQ